jgi:hypothetical protein
MAVEAGGALIQKHCPHHISKYVGNLSTESSVIKKLIMVKGLL